ncbi:glycoside hydrolase family 88 protein [Gynurincola endophyticus]|uniref:glycoside hydrolase family 88 protein n=1 Tax=Gynurincola endophyticus TaxID=2479004 RepID=UPI000F8F6420|nr:glycoside hydrolase family 88 protein [Gynurincola endophyticus]
MKWTSLCLLIAAGFITISGNKSEEAAFVKQNLEEARKQVILLLKDADADKSFPRTTNAQGKLVTTNMYDWTPGFFPGTLWYTFENTPDANLKDAAIRWTEKLEPLKDFTEHHDLGFMVYCSYGNAYRLTQNKEYKDLLVQAARSLSTRFNTTVGCIKSWNRFHSWHGNKTYDFPVIIDNMMNLELLFFATKVTGDSSFYKIAVTHADNTLKHQFRKDYSSYHVITYDTLTGKVTGKETAQGYSDNSTWSRGQAWAIYGYTMTYRETGNPAYLKAAIGMAEYYLNNKNLPKDKIPYWDFNIHQKGFVPGKKSYALQVNTPYRDVSAAAITASALFELSTYDRKKENKFRNAAIKMLHSLSASPYKAALNTNGNFILKHSVGSIPHETEIDVPLVYADYYYVEALTRYKQYLNGTQNFKVSLQH